jgi:hypothetical protein
VRAVVASVQGEFRRYKTLAEDAIAQLDETRIGDADGISNSIGTIVWHVAGNLTSRFTDFLTTDGEKPWRERDSEFLERRVTRGELLTKWESGWSILFAALSDLSDVDLERRVAIRGQGLSVAEALHRALAHVSYHVGQIVYIAKSLRGADWRYLSIPPGKSAEANANPHQTIAAAPKS